MLLLGMLSACHGLSCPFDQIPAHATQVLDFEDIRGLYRDYHVNPVDADLALIRYGVYPLGPIQIYDARSPDYHQALKSAGHQLKEAELCGISGICHSHTNVWATTNKERRSIIGIVPERQTRPEIALTIAEELAHARFAKDPKWHEDHGELVIGKAETFSLVDEFQAKTRAATEIRGAARAPVEILREINQNYPELKPGRADFELLLYLTTKFSHVPLEKIAADDLVKIAFQMPMGIESQLEMADTLALARFRQVFRTLVD